MSDNPKSTLQLVAILDGKDKFLQKTQIKAYFDQFLEQGRPNYQEVLKVPSNERILALNEHLGAAESLKIISIPISQCLTAAGIDNLDLTISIASQIIDEAHEDNLSLQDLFIFAKGFISGKYAGRDGVTTYGRITQISFMDRFEVYRQERHEALMNIREEEAANHKALGPTEREYDKSPDQQRLAVKDLMEYHFKKDQNE